MSDPSMGLQLTIRRGETLLINGAEVVFLERSTILLTTHASFMFGKQVMRPDQANTPLRRIYRQLQAYYAGEDFGLPEARTGLLRDMEEASNHVPISHQDRLQNAMNLVRSGDYHPALKLMRWMIQEAEIGVAA